MAVVADRCPNIKIEVVDINLDRIKAWNQEDLSKLPIFEPGLSEIINRVRGKNLFFSNEIEKSIRTSDMIFISVNTPIKEIGIGAGETSDLRFVELCARQISDMATGHTIVVEKSTLPVKTAQTIKSILDSAVKNKKGEKRSFSVLSNPEFLAEGTAIENLEFPDRVLIGGDDEIAIESLKEVYLNWIPREKIICTNLWSSELSKLTANAFLAQRISSINSISAICEATGAEIKEVANAVGKDSRIGEKFLRAGPGFGGSCFKKDILNLVYLCKYYGLYEIAEYWNNIVKINSWQKKRIYELVVNKLYGNLSDKKIAILGFSFKANTNDTRESPAIDICSYLINEGAFLKIHDYKVNEFSIKDALIKSDIISPNKKEKIENSFSFKDDVYEAINSSDAILILTEWKEYKSLDWDKISKITRKPTWVFDTRVILDIKNLKKFDFNLWQLGLGE